MRFQVLPCLCSSVRGTFGSSAVLRRRWRLACRRHVSVLCVVSARSLLEDVKAAVLLRNTVVFHVCLRFCM